ncbi:hypothetical protein L3X38_010354 [Prunus dulcis]|uniref:Uncharacterized protein n=1 Tax=Prunus dulcis TaxID=3755 RepID=A0AAD4WFP1_PRUDU|nr:hypothetical protein L3X38_010354 [Prunus dulcis]
MAVEGGGDRHWATGEELMEVVQGWEVGSARAQGAAQEAIRWGISSSRSCASKGASKQLSKGAAMGSLANFPAFQGVVRPLLSQGGSAPGCHIGTVRTDEGS